MFVCVCVAIVFVSEQSVFCEWYSRSQVSIASIDDQFCENEFLRNWQMPRISSKSTKIYANSKAHIFTQTTIPPFPLLNLQWRHPGVYRFTVDAPKLPLSCSHIFFLFATVVLRSIVTEFQLVKINVISARMRDSQPRVSCLQKALALVRLVMRMTEAGIGDSSPNEPTFIEGRWHYTVAEVQL